MTTLTPPEDSTLRWSTGVTPLTCTIGAELTGIDLAAAAHDDALPSPWPAPVTTAVFPDSVTIIS
ncbi:hypothetical protein [Nocardia sp. NPDC051981]|uniref:hypothetical protein n=1 Tax=Nocardia sp. NPDC051981 TaxID=3155417 RepID=UPI00343ADCF8